MPITSPNNEQLKEVRKLAGRKWRDKTRTFIAEGEDLIEAAAAAGWQPEIMLCEAGSGLPGDEVAPHLLKQYSQLGSGTRAIAVYPQRWAPVPVGPVCVALWGVADPGNVGTVLRSAVAFGAGSVALGPGTADPYGHKDVTLVVGAEREGLSAGVVAACDEAVHIPIRSESLNAAMAATIGLYEVAGRVARA
jgi:TrmH family RNA methyltransferase